MSSPTGISPASLIGGSDEISITTGSVQLGRIVGEGDSITSEHLTGELDPLCDTHPKVKTKLCNLSSDCLSSTLISNLEQKHDIELDMPSPRAYPDSMPEYPLSAIRALTRTSCVNRLYPSSIAPGCDPQGLLFAVERNWHSMACRFALQDLQAGRVGRRLEHDWFADGVDVVIIFDLEVGPISLKLMDCAGWDPLKMRKSQALFVDSLIMNAEWVCPVHLTGSRMREVSVSSLKQVASRDLNLLSPCHMFLCRSECQNQK